MIKLNPAPTFEADIRLTVPGAAEPVEVKMTLRHMALDKIDAWYAKNKDRKPVDALDEIIAGWSGVIGDDGQEVPYSREALATLTNNYAAATSEIILGWQRALTESRVKN